MKARNDTFDCLKNIYFHGNSLINDHCIEELLTTLNKTCPRLRYIDRLKQGLQMEVVIYLINFMKLIHFEDSDDNEKRD